jgi:hypothetical protein
LTLLSLEAQHRFASFALAYIDSERRNLNDTVAARVAGGLQGEQVMTGRVRPSPHTMFVYLGVVIACIAGVTPRAHAEAGDYSAWQTIVNLVSPPRADNPVTAPQMQGPYPLLLNPSSFSDGFSPGGYYQWQTVKLAPSTGAVCGNGSQYKFFVNRVPNTRNTII